MGIDPGRPRATRGGGLPAGGARPAGSPAWTAQTLREVRPPLVIDTAASARSAGWVRGEFSAWLAVDVSGELLDDLVLAVSEAVANVAEHAYVGCPGGSGPVRLRARRHREAIAVTVADDGRWRAPTGAPYRSRGLPLIRALVDDVHIDHTPTGTVVHLRAGVPRLGAGSRDAPPSPGDR